MTILLVPFVLVCLAIVGITGGIDSEDCGCSDKNYVEHCDK